jgi:predicted cytidylate kinase
MNSGLESGGPTLVAVAGQIGSGKTEVCRALHRRTGWEVVSAGNILRRMAAERGMSVLELNEYARMDVAVDREIDAYLASLAGSAEPLIVDSRLAWHFLPTALKAYLVVDPTVGAERVFKAGRIDEAYPSLEVACVNNKERQRIERERFMRLYAVDPEHWRNYDLVIDTTSASAAEVASIALAACTLPAQIDNKPACWLCPKRLIPTQSIRELVSDRANELWSRVQSEGWDDQFSIDVAVYRGTFLIIDGHVRVSMALRLQRPLISARLIAFEAEEVLGGLSGEAFARTSTSLSTIYDWEDAHRFRLSTYPPWFDVKPDIPSVAEPS